MDMLVFLPEIIFFFLENMWGQAHTHQNMFSILVMNTIV